MSNESENLSGATVEMSAADFELPTDGNNTPEKQLDRERLELDMDSINRLSVKPVQKYRFVRSIGRGGMKMVLQTKDLDATRDVAMAVLPEATTRPREDLVRFIQEARITASLEHPNIVPVHEIGVDSTGAPYYTMKLLRGKTLAALISKLAEGDETFNSEYNTIRLLRIFLKICNGVAFAHSKGVIHLDLKPENIQVGDFGEVLIMDWGLAKVRDHLKEEDTLDFEVDVKDSGFGNGTLDGIMKGTPGYMAPEQAAGKNSQKDERTDIYSLGAILYSLMTWKEPLEEKTVKERIEATLAGRIIPPSERAPEREIPAGVEAVIRKAMSLNPAERYQSVRELRNEVNAFIGGYATIAEKASIAKKTVLFFRRNLLLTALLALILFFLIVGTSYVFLTYHRDMSWQTVLESDRDSWRNVTLMAPGNKVKQQVRLQSWHGGALLHTNEWLWIDQPVSGNIRLTATIVAPENTELDVVLAAKDQPLEKDNAFPAGLCIRLNTQGGWHSIAGAGERSAVNPKTLAATKNGKMTGKFSFMLTKEDNRITLYQFEKNKWNAFLETELPLSYAGLELRHIGFRSQNSPVTLKDVTLRQQNLPDTPAPMVRPMILEEEGLYRQAFEQYLLVASLYPGDTFADHALTRAYRLAATQLADDPEFRQRVADAVEDIPAFTRDAEIAVCEAFYLWNTEKYDEALDAAEKILEKHPQSIILQQFLAMSEKNMPEKTAQRLLSMLARTRNGQTLEWLDLSCLNLQKLDAVSGMKNLKWLDCSQNKLNDLSPLKDLDLDYLNCSGNPALNKKTIPADIKTVIQD